MEATSRLARGGARAAVVDHVVDNLIDSGVQQVCLLSGFLVNGVSLEDLAVLGRVYVRVKPWTEPAHFITPGIGHLCCLTCQRSFHRDVVEVDTRFICSLALSIVDK